MGFREVFTTIVEYLKVVCNMERCSFGTSFFLSHGFHIFGSLAETKTLHHVDITCYGLESMYILLKPFPFGLCCSLELMLYTILSFDSPHSTDVALSINY